MNDATQVVAEAKPAPYPTHTAEREAFELALRKAKVLAASTLVPPQYQDNIPNCLIGINMARRIGADELMVLQNLYIVQGKPGWSAQFLIATFNQCGRFTAMRFEWKGEPGTKDRGCRAYATEKATGERITGAWVTWEMAVAEGWTKKAGSKWLTMPEQMFTYRAAAFLVRTHAPEIAMGLQTVEEIRDVIDVEPEPAPTKTDAVTAALKAKLAPAVAPIELTEPAPPAPAPATKKSKPAPAPDEFALDGTPSAGPTYAEVRAIMDSAKTTDDVDLAESLVDGLPQQFRAELHEYATKRRDALEAAARG